jgi:hypothetical protein
VNLDQLGASFAQNRTAILGTAAAGVVGFALYKRKQAGGATAAPASAAAPVYSAGGQTAGMYGANAYDSSASDVYGLVQPQLESLGSQLSDLNTKLGSVPVSQAPASPVASRLANPLYNGNYIRNAGGGFAEIESDGSLLGLTAQQWANAYKVAGQSGVNVQQLSAPNFGPSITYTEQNILNNAAKALPQPAKTS